MSTQPVAEPYIDHVKDWPNWKLVNYFLASLALTPTTCPAEVRDCTNSCTSTRERVILLLNGKMVEPIPSKFLI